MARGTKQRLNVLFICSKNRWRSPTAEEIYSGDPRMNVRSRGTSTSAKRSVNYDDLTWADVIMVMEPKHKERLNHAFPMWTTSQEFVVLDIPDDYRFMNPELIEMISTAVESHMEQRLAREP